VIRLEKLSKSFGRTKALDGLTLTAEAGEKIALVGANGAGKTTLFRCLLGEYEYDGVVRVDDRDPRRDRTSVLKNVGFVPQLPPPLRMPVKDLIGFATGVSGADRGQIVRVAADLGLDVAEVANRPFIKLSGGQKQKLLIAIALGRETRFLILDEPAANLDPPARAVLFALLERHGEEEAQRRNGAVDGGRLHPALALVNLKPANILGRRRIRRPSKEGREAANKANILVLRIRSQAAHRHIFEHALPQRADGAFDR
jgi:ABC-2 type transport system ATP-binding protein